MNPGNTNCGEQKTGKGTPSQNPARFPVRKPESDKVPNPGRHPLPNILERFPNVFHSLRELREVQPAGPHVEPLVRTLPLAEAAKEILAEWHTRIRSRNALARMSETEMRDLGLTVSQITAEVNKPFWRA